MSLDDLKVKYNNMQNKYGDKSLDPIYFGGCKDSPRICFVFMNPTSRNIASSKSWKGLKAPWIGTKNIWDLFYSLSLIDKNTYDEIKSRRSSEWNPLFAENVYDDVTKHKVFITNLGKCTQIDARVLPDSVFIKYLSYLEKEIEIINPKVIILFGNQVSSIFLKEKISVSTARKKEFIKKIKGKEYRCYSVYYPVGNGRFNIDKSIEDIKWITCNIDLYKSYYHSPLGTIVMQGSCNFLTGLYFESFKILIDDDSYTVNDSLDVFKITREWLDKYFRGENPSIDNIPIKLNGSSFSLEVYEILKKIPYGKTVTYKDIAFEISLKSKKKMSSQAVGQAVSRNPISIIIPCHRVVGIKGLTGYAAGLDIKEKLLEIEKM